MNQRDEIIQLIQRSKTVRENSVKRFYSIPEGYENWKAMEVSMTVGNIIQHLIDADHWLFEQMQNPRLKLLGPNREKIYTNNRTEYIDMINELIQIGHKKIKRFVALANQQFNELSIHDSEYDIPQWCLFLKENMDHELHHTGQVSVYLELIENNYPGVLLNKRIEKSEDIVQ